MEMGHKKITLHEIGESIAKLDERIEKEKNFFRNLFYKLAMFSCTFLGSILILNLKILTKKEVADPYSMTQAQKITLVIIIAFSAVTTILMLINIYNERKHILLLQRFRGNFYDLWKNQLELQKDILGEKQKEILEKCYRLPEESKTWEFTIKIPKICISCSGIHNFRKIMRMKKLLPLLLSFILGALSATLICTATMRHVVSREHAAMISELQQEKIWLGQKIASLVLELSPDLRESGKEVLVGRDGSVEVKSIE